MTKYLVDYENVKCDGLSGIDKLNKDDEVYVFYSINADRITFDLHNMINASKAKIKFFNIEVGSKNALDFQLTTYLGYLISNNKKAKFVIVTKDKDYAVVSSFWKKMEADVSIQPDLIGTTSVSVTLAPEYLVEEEKVEEEVVVKKATNKKRSSSKRKKTSKAKTKANKSEELSDQYDQQLKDKVYNLVNDDKQAILLANYIEKYKTKLGLNNAIVKVYGTTVGGQLYKTIKPLISDKKGN